MGWDCLAEVIRKARKPHQCIWCGGVIETGDKYQYSSGIFDGDFQSNHWHLACWEVTEGLDPDDGFIPYENYYGKAAL